MGRARLGPSDTTCRTDVVGPRPPSGSAAGDRDGIVEAITLARELVVRGLVDGPVLAAAISYGGRQTSMVAAENPGLVGLTLFSYPLHPPESPRTCGPSISAPYRSVRCSPTERPTLRHLDELRLAVELILRTPRSSR